MKKITITLIALMVISVGFLSGCNEISNSLSGDESRFVGTWNFEFEGLFETKNYTFTFFSDGTCSASGFFGSNYEVKDEKLVFWQYMDGNKLQTPYTYSFSDNDTVVQIAQVSGELTYVLYKQ